MVEAPKPRPTGTTITITDTDLGQTVATNGILNNIKMVAAPHEYRSYLTLVDTYFGFENEIFNVDPTTSGVSADSFLMSDGGMPFGSLIVKNIPKGSSFEIEFTPPPVLSSLSPNTAISGDPDFTLLFIGTDLIPNCIIVFGAYDEPTTFVSDTEVTTGVKPSLFAPAVVPVKLRVGSFFTDPVDFTFTEPVGAEAEAEE